jgi:hypothetical protein
MNIKIYDNGGKTTDRYTVLFLDDSYKDHIGQTIYDCLNMNSIPDGVYGFRQHSEAIDGDHLGKRIAFKDLPKKVQTSILLDYDIKDTA